MPRDLEARAANKLILRNVMGLSQEPGALVVGVVSRLSWQKGLDLLLEVLPALLAEGMQLALLGSGEAELEAKFLAAAEAYPGKIGVKIGYDEALAHRIQAGADALLDAVALRALRPYPALRAPLWRRARRGAGRRTFRHGYRRQRDGARRGRGNGRAVLPR